MAKVIGNLKDIDGNNTYLDSTGIVHDSQKLSNIIGLKKLWENEDTTSSFSEQTITLSNDDYDYLIWYYKYYVSQDYVMSATTPKGHGAMLSCADTYQYSTVRSGWYISSFVRKIERVSDTEFTVPACSINYYDRTDAGTSDNYLIPVAIYGGKF